MSLLNVYRELTVPYASVEESLDNGRLDVVTVLTKRRHNSGCAAAVLPPELLSYVFSMNVLSDRPVRKNGKHSFFLGWISATQVCHQWREVCAANHQPGFPMCVQLNTECIRSRSQRPPFGNIWTLIACREGGVRKCCADPATVPSRSRS